jgi:hypothetical protein
MTLTARDHHDSQPGTGTGTLAFAAGATRSKEAHLLYAFQLTKDVSGRSWIVAGIT